ncbi:hypothetical protein [Alloyangia pacifica]|uniref:hypothetical protein n=1 Tax=Alloyangia pacifica TaxID=311180 RepID=UPI001CD35899|nr:hypothetical protein [Alloyangia pacifica]MCA0998627.1 hypothetical protein [Alloyangia pacifica]
MTVLNAFVDTLWSFWAACNAETHTLSGMLSVLSVGSGLYLGLAVVQVVGAGRMATLRRRVGSIRNLVNKNSLTNCSHVAGNLEAKLLTAEIGLETLSSSLFATSLILLSACLGAIFYSTAFQSKEISCAIVGGLGLYCLVLPLGIFIASSAIIRLRTRSVAKEVKEASTTVKAALANRHS